MVREYRDCPFTRKELEAIAQKCPTPFHLIEEAPIRANLKDLHSAFAWALQDGKPLNYYAVKANPLGGILQITTEEGCGADCSSKPELRRAEWMGLKGDQIMFTANNVGSDEYREADRLGAVINFDSFENIPFFHEHLGKMPDIACMRYNPGPLKKGNGIIGDPSGSKYGAELGQMIEGFKMLKDAGVNRFGLHTMVASNERENVYFIETAQILFDTIRRISGVLGIQFELVNIGGGIGIPYEPDHKPVDLHVISRGIQKAYEEAFAGTEQQPRLCMENGRMITGPYGHLVTRAIHEKTIYGNHFIGVDTAMNNNPRPAMYGAYHPIWVPGKEHLPHNNPYHIVGPLCEDNDRQGEWVRDTNGNKIYIPRNLPQINVGEGTGDLVVIGNTGAHSPEMGSHYNSRLLCATLLDRMDGIVQMIREAETEEQLYMNDPLFRGRFAK